MSDRVTISVESAVADVRLNRPEKLNALDGPMFEALVEAGDVLRADPSVRAVVLSGQGRAFCAGLDVGSFATMAGDGGDGGGDGSSAPRLVERPEGRIANRAQQVAYAWTELAVPVIAAVHGVALGGGLQIALGADLRLVSPDARLSVMEIRWGLVPDMTGTQVLPGLVGLDVAKELTFTGRMVSGEEAVRLGLATRLSESPRDDALALAGEIAARSPAAIRGAKELLGLAGRVSLADGFAAEERVQLSLIGSSDQVEAVRAAMEERAPVFQGP